MSSNDKSDNVSQSKSKLSRHKSLSSIESTKDLGSTPSQGRIRRASTPYPSSTIALKQRPIEAQTPLSDIIGNGISSKDIKSLNEEGLFTVQSILFCPRKNLISIKGISEAKADLLIKEANRKIPTGFETAAQILTTRSEILKIKTGSQALDDILGGGIETGSITEVWGESRTGKTQFCHSLAVMSLLKTDDGGTEGKTMFIDTTGSFRTERILALVSRFSSLDPSKALEDVVVARAYSTDHLTKLLISAAAMMTTERYGLLIVDSLTGIFRTEYEGRGELAERQQKLGRTVRRLQKLADEFGISVLITNQVVAKVDGGPFDEKLKPIGGHVLAHATTTRLSFKKLTGEKRMAKVENSPLLKEDTALFVIKADGINDLNENDL